MADTPLYRFCQLLGRRIQDLSREQVQRVLHGIQSVGHKGFYKDVMQCRLRLVQSMWIQVCLGMQSG